MGDFRGYSYRFDLVHFSFLARASHGSLSNQRSTAKWSVPIYRRGNILVSGMFRIVLDVKDQVDWPTSYKVWAVVQTMQSRLIAFDSR